MMGSNFGFLRRSVKRAVAAKRNGASRLAFWLAKTRRSGGALAEPQKKVSRKILWRRSDAPRASRRKENFTNPKKPWKRPRVCLFAATADPAGAAEAERPGCARRRARDRASARVRPPALRVAARSGLHHSSQAPGNGAPLRARVFITAAKPLESDALIVMTEGNPEAEISAKVLARRPKLFPTPTRSARSAEHEKPIGNSFQEMRGRELRDIIKELRQVCAGGVLTFLTERQKQRQKSTGKQADSALRVGLQPAPTPTPPPRLTPRTPLH